MMSSLTGGVCLIVIGFLLLIKALFGIHIPIFRMLFGIGFIYFGITLITNMSIHCFTQQTGQRTTTVINFFSPTNNPNQENVCFGSQASQATDRTKTEYNTVFGKLTLDLSDLPAHAFDKPLKLRTVFGSTEVILPKDVPARIILTCSFGSATYPGGSHAAFGTREIHIGDASQEPGIVIEAEVVFGTLTIV
jgi:predicted membrane protein